MRQDEPDTGRCRICAFAFMDESKTYDADLSAFTPDPHNANAGTERGVYMVEESLQRNGAARSIVVSVDNVVLAGNKTIEAAASVGIQKARVVEVDGDTLVVVKRTDVQAGTPKALDIAISDNRASEVGLDWNAEALEWAQEQGADLSAWWTEGELDALLSDVELVTDDPLGANTQRVTVGMGVLVNIGAFVGFWKDTGNVYIDKRLIERFGNGDESVASFVAWLIEALDGCPVSEPDA